MGRFSRSMLVVLALAALTLAVTAGTAAAQYAPSISVTVEDCVTITVTGNGFEPGTDVTVTFASDPVVLGNLEADDEGEFEGTFSLPAGSTNGDHTVTVKSDDDTESVGVTLSGCGGAQQQAALALTGSNSFPWAAAGIALVLAGVILAVIAGRRRSAHSIGS